MSLKKDSFQMKSTLYRIHRLGYAVVHEKVEHIWVFCQFCKTRRELRKIIIKLIQQVLSLKFFIKKKKLVFEINQPDSDDSKKKKVRKLRVGNKSDTILLLTAYDHCILFLEDPKLLEKHRVTSQQVMPSHVCSSLEKHLSQKEHNEMFPKRKWLST